MVFISSNQNILENEQVISSLIFKLISENQKIQSHFVLQLISKHFYETKKLNDTLKPKK